MFSSSPLTNHANSLGGRVKLPTMAGKGILSL